MPYPVGFRTSRRLSIPWLRPVLVALVLLLALGAGLILTRPLWAGAYHRFRASDYTSKAEAAIAASRWDDAVLFARNALRHDAGRVAAWQALTTAELKRGGPAVSETVAMAAIQSGFDPAITMQAIDRLVESGQRDPAGQLALAAVSRRRDNAPLLARCGRLALEANTPVLAEVFLREADRLAPGDLRVSLDLARCGLLSTNAVTRAVALERLDSLSRSSAVQEEAARVLAFHLTRTGDPRAEAAWGRLLEVNPNDWEASLFRAMVITRTNAAAAVWQRPWSEAKSDRIRADVIRAMAVTAGPLTALEFLEQTQAGKSTSAAPLALGRLELEGSLKRWREVSAGAEQVVKRADATAEERFIGQLWRAVASRELGQASAYDESLQAALSMVRGNPSQALQGAFWLERAGHAEAADPFFALAAESPDRAVRVQALRRMVQRAAQRDNPVATESAARQLLAIQPDDSLGQILLVSSLIAQPAKRDQGEQRARRLSADRPEWTAMRLLCLQAMMMRGPSGDLMQQFQDADKLVYTSAVDRIVMARAAVMCRRFDRAEAWLTGVDPARLPTVHQETVRQLRQQIAAEAKPAGA